MYKQQSIKSYKRYRRGQPVCFAQQWCVQQKVHLLNVNNIGHDMGEEIYSYTLLNRLWHYQCADVLVPRKIYSY